MFILLSCKASRHILCTLHYSNCWEFLGGPVVRTPHFHCMDSMPGQGTNIPQAAKKKKVIKGNKSYPQRESNNGRRTGEEDQKES